MIRFLPDTWLDVVMRPFDMVSPEGNTYVEIAAPDLRMAAAVVLGLLALLAWRRSRPPRGPVLTLLLLTVLAMVPWLLTTGNGRYFIPFLLLLGPLCIGLVRLLPVTGALRLTLAGLLVALQCFLLGQTTPWNTWSLGIWSTAPYFRVDSPPQATDVNYVIVSNISYSLIAPQFPPQAGWINLTATAPGERGRTTLRDALGGPRPLILLTPSIASQTLDDGQPSEAVLKALGDLIADQGLTIPDASRCQLLKSAGLATVTIRMLPTDAEQARVGFWLCPLKFDASTMHPPANVERMRVDAVFEVVERLCPRFFPAGTTGTQKVAGGFMRQYSESDTKIYVFDSGEVMYKFWRSLNPVMIGSQEQVRAGQISVDCSRIRAPNWRKGGP